MSTYAPAPNDHLSRALERANIVPERMRGTDRFLDVVTWNIRYFHHKDTARVRRIASILRELNADIIVCQEILEGALDPVADLLGEAGSGHYTTAYGDTGGQQRIAMMWDVDWIRAKDDIAELFGKGAKKTDDGKDAFPRLPLRGYFTSLSQSGIPFDFQLIGLHLKSQRADTKEAAAAGTKQRQLSARALRDWLTSEAQEVDADVIMVGDWNAPPKDKAWDPLAELEAEGDAAFRKINDEGDISHLLYRNRNDYGSRLDLGVVTKSALRELKEAPKPVRWETLDRVVSEGTAAELRAYVKETRENISDHLPVVSRFYFTERS